MPSGKEMAPASTGASTGAANSPRSSAARNLGPGGGGPPAEPDGHIGAKSWRRRWGSLGILDAQRRGDGARVYGHQDQIMATTIGAARRTQRTAARRWRQLRRAPSRRRELPAQQLTLAVSAAPNYGGGDGGRSTDSTPSGEEMAPTNKGAKAGEENSRRSSLEALLLATTTLMIMSASATAMTAATGGTVCSPRSGAVRSPT